MGGLDEARRTQEETREERLDEDDDQDQKER